MFIIARRRGQRIEIGDEIIVTVTEISGNTVKLGISAPRDCPIVRGELKDSVELANRQAVEAGISVGNPLELEGEPTAQDGVTDTEAFLRAAVKPLSSSHVNDPTDDSVVPK